MSHTLFKMSSADPRPGSVNPGIINPLFTIDERDDARQTIAKAEAELQRIETDIVRLLECHEIVMYNISQLKKSLVIHRVLPTEIMGYIFSILRAERVSIPHEWRMTPPQITVSHVCSEWRAIALATPALWGDVEIMWPNNDHWVQIAQLILNRAGSRGVNLALNMTGVQFDELEYGYLLYDIVLPLHVKKLHLTLFLSDLEHLLQNSDDIMANIDEVALDTPGDDPSEVGKLSIGSQFLSKIKSLTCSDETFILHGNLSWAQMRYLNVRTVLTPAGLSDTLRQSPLLEVCKTKLELDDEIELDNAELLTLPQLRLFHILLDPEAEGSRYSLDVLLQSFKCPNLTDLSFEIPCWTPGTYKLIQTHFNFHRLLKLKLTGYPYPISKILHDAPALQELVIIREFILMDENAIHAISSGKLGRCLTSLGLKGDFDIRGVLDMTVARQRCVKHIIEAGHGWQDQISVIKRLLIPNDDKEEFKAQVDELKELGINVYHSLDFDFE